jgi:hypothetical protein
MLATSGERFLEGEAANGTDRFDCFVGTTKERTAKRYGVVGVNLTATRS